MLHLPLLVVLAAPVQAADPAPVVFQADPLVLLDNYGAGEPADCNDPSGGLLCSETAIKIHYPDGMGPPALGHPVDPRPVIIGLRGGNSQKPVPDNFDTWFDDHGFLDAGYVGIDANFPIIDGVGVVGSDSTPGGSGGARGVTSGGGVTGAVDPVLGPVSEDYTTAADAVARLIQYVRAHAAWLNVDPGRVIVFGRSFGGVMAYAVGLRQDDADPASADPVERESSRPDQLVAFSAPTAIDCFASTTKFSSYMKAYFPVATAPGATLAQKQAVSPRWWLENPQVYGRTTTPPMFLGYNLQFTDGPCGQMVDPHDGRFGLIMWSSLDALVEQQNDPEPGVTSLLLDSGDFYGFAGAMAEVLEWIPASAARAVPNVYLIPKDGIVVPAGQPTQFKTVGSTGQWMLYFLGFQEGEVPIPGCSLFKGRIADYTLLGAGIVQPDGTTTFDLNIPTAAVGIQFLMQGLNLQRCEITNLVELYTY